MTSRVISFISLNYWLDVLTVTVENADKANIRNLKATIKQELDIATPIIDIEIFKVNASLISAPLFLDLPDDAQAEKVRELLASATFLKSAHLLSNILPATDYDPQAIHFIVNYPRYITLSYVAYINGYLHHESDVVTSNKLTVSGLRGIIAKELERKDCFLKLFSVWDGFLADGELPKALTTTEGRIPLDTHVVLSTIFPFETEHRVDVIICADFSPNIYGMNTRISAMPIVAKALHPPLEELDATRRPNEKTDSEGDSEAERVKQPTAMPVAVQCEAEYQLAERKRLGEQEELAYDKRTNLGESCEPGENKLRSCEGYHETQVTCQTDEAKVSEGEKETVRSAEEVNPEEGHTVASAKAMVDEPQRQTNLVTTILAEQRQYIEWARQHGQNVENLLEQLTKKI